MYAGSFEKATVGDVWVCGGNVIVNMVWVGAGFSPVCVVCDGGVCWCVHVGLWVVECFGGRCWCGIGCVEGLLDGVKEFCVFNGLRSVVKECC